MPKRQLTGKIVSNKMQKTVVVEVESVKENSLYKKQFKMHKKYKAHTEEGKYQIGEVVTIEECQPISRDKRWQVVEEISKKLKIACLPVGRKIKNSPEKKEKLKNIFL